MKDIEPHVGVVTHGVGNAQHEEIGKDDLTEIVVGVVAAMDDLAQWQLQEQQQDQWQAEPGSRAPGEIHDRAQVIRQPPQPRLRPWHHLGRSDQPPAPCKAQSDG